MLHCLRDQWHGHCPEARVADSGHHCPHATSGSRFGFLIRELRVLTHSSGHFGPCCMAHSVASQINFRFQLNLQRRLTYYYTMT